MITIRRAEDRGKTRQDWLLSYHTFSFGTYHDPTNNGFKTLRVLNDDLVAPEGGFPTHPHRDMEILSYVIQGALEHKDSLGNQGMIREGEVQLMTAGSGVTHSEFNPSETESLHFLQIWIRPEKKGLTPQYQKKYLHERERLNRFQLIASHAAEKGVLQLHQKGEVYASALKKGHALKHPLEQGMSAWLHVVNGEILLGEIHLKSGDGVGFEKEAQLALSAQSDSEILLFLLPDD